MEVIRIESWDELVSELYRDDHVAEIDRFRSPYVYRGLSRDFPLEPGLARLRHPPAVIRRIERYLFRSFRKYAHQEVDGNSSWRWLSIAQHHGLPTRLLDWTYSPFVAMHFATADMTSYDADGVIWCFNIIDSRTFLPRKLREALEVQGSTIFSVEMLEHLYAEFWDIDEEEYGREFAVCFEPPSLNARIVNQVGLFTFMSPSDVLLDQWIAQRPRERTLAKKIIVPSTLKWTIRDRLDQANVNERVLFPGLDGISSWLRRWYTPKRPVGGEPTQVRSDAVND